MFSAKHPIGSISSAHERYLRLIQQNYSFDFEVLLENANEKPLHQKCIELLMIEVYKYLNGLFPDIVSDIFKLQYLQSKKFNITGSQNSRTKTFGLDRIAYKASQLWKNVPEEIRNSISLPIFKKKIRKVP